VLIVLCFALLFLLLCGHIIIRVYTSVLVSCLNFNTLHAVNK
jgi:hypothetical protein